MADARRAVEAGCDGIVVSNHAGRQVDGARASLDALEDIVKAGIGEQCVVTFDSGVRGASDVIKALCLGAKFVWIGRYVPGTPLSLFFFPLQFSSLIKIKTFLKYIYIFFNLGPHI